MNSYVLVLCLLAGLSFRGRAASTETASAVSASPAVSEPVALEQVLLTAEEVAPGCKLVKDRRPASSEAQVFYQHGSNSLTLPLVFQKTDQGFECGRDKGVVYYFQYVDRAGRENAERAARASIWKDEAQATPRHPDQIFGWDRFLIVVSFKDPAWKTVMAPLIKKLKRLEAAQQ